jgi:hypothetical protein
MTIGQTHRRGPKIRREFMPRWTRQRSPIQLPGGYFWLMSPMPFFCFSCNQAARRECAAGKTTLVVYGAFSLCCFAAEGFEPAAAPHE